MTRTCRAVTAMLLALVLAGCASGPKALPQCDGPWTPLNSSAKSAMAAPPAVAKGDHGS